MDCNIIRDKLIDYIDGVLDKDEENLVKIHLNKCNECNNEYEDIKESIDYINENKQNINSANRDIELKPYCGKIRKIRKITRTGLIAVILSLMLVITAYGTDIFDFLKWWQKSSEIRTTAWERLIDNGVGDVLDVSVVYDDIRVTAEGVIADEINTVILLRIEDLKDNIRLTPSFYDYEEDGIRGITIEGDIEKHHRTNEYMLDYIDLYAEEENTLRLMLITNPMTRDTGNIKINIRKLMDKVNKDEKSRIIKEGNWDLEITANKIYSKQIEVDELLEFDGNEVWVKKITLAPTETNIEYEFRAYNNEKKYYLNSLSFNIEYDGKIYGQTNIGIPNMSYISTFGMQKSTDSLESLYLEDPSDIKLMVEQYRYSNNRYTNIGDKIYEIDFGNLPQVIEYNNSKITIEEIIDNEDVVELIIKEDDSKDRNYIATDMNITYGPEEGNTNIISYFSYPIEWELRDEHGKVETIEGMIMNKKMHHFVIRQKVDIKRDNGDNFGISDDIIHRGKLHIIGQRYIGFPDIEVYIKLR